MKQDVQHFLPAFLLRQWQSGQDNKLTAFAWKNGELRADRLKASSVGAMRGVYAKRTGEAAERNVMESAYFSPLDNEAAKMHRAVLHGQSDFAPRDIKLWAHFTLALDSRTPWSIERLAAETPAMLAEKRAEIEAEGMEAWPVDEEDDESPEYFRDLTLETIPRALGRGAAVDALASATWQVLKFDTLRFDLVIGDQAVLRQGPLTGRFIILVPISPRRAVLAADQATADAVLRLTPREMARRMNIASAGRAHQYVYATSAAQQALCAKYLRKT